MNLLLLIYFVFPVPPLGSQTVVLVCPTCKERVTTKVKKETSNTAYRWCVWLFIVG